MNIDEAAKKLTSEPDDKPIPGVLTEFNTRFEVVELHPGDIIFLSIPGSLAPEILEFSKTFLKDAFPENRVIILENDMHIDAIVRPEAANEPG
jgi:hypothetical protein